MKNSFSRESFTRLHQAVESLRPHRYHLCYVVQVKIFERMTGNNSWHYFPYADFPSALKCYMDFLTHETLDDVYELVLQTLLPVSVRNSDGLPF